MISYGGNNRTHMVRIPDPGRFELRLADGAANPYLMPAAVLAAGLDGMAKKTDPGKRLDIDMYSEPHKAKGVKKLPIYLLDAIRLFEKNKTLRAALGEDFSKAFLRIKGEEWDNYARDLSAWERKNTLDC
jgi:glutamine synthetase